MALELFDTINLQTKLGEYKIELCFGDISMLDPSNAVDLVLVSAFMGDYTPIRGTVLGSLKENLNIDVQYIARHEMEEDLRKYYSVWYSKPLKQGLPYKRVMCFETLRRQNERPPELIGHVFRCMMPIFKNKESSVITPLLSTGNQGYSRVVMLENTVTAAAKWIKAGLPLKQLKIVVYCAYYRRDASLDQITSTFMRLKQKLETKTLDKIPSPSCDIYLSYAEPDKAVAVSILKRMQTVKPAMQVCYGKRELDAEHVWQDDIYKMMVNCVRVVTVITPAYLANSACIEQFNIAFCCTQKIGRDLLAPFYIRTINDMPAYMSLVQYMDCRESSENKIIDHCDILVSLMESVSVLEPKKLVVVEKFDIFISYRQSDRTISQKLLEYLKARAPDLNIFYDQNTLKTGATWQQAIYKAIENSRCMISLLSSDYLKSSICQEEYNLSCHLHCSSKFDHVLVPVLIQSSLTLPENMTKVNPITDISSDYTAGCVILADTMYNWSIGTTNSEIIPAKLDIDLNFKAFQEKRRGEYIRKYNMGFPYRRFDEFSSKSEDIYISHTQDDNAIAQVMEAFLKLYCPHLNVLASNDFCDSESHEAVAQCSTAALVITLLSQDYLESKKSIEELNIGLNRQRGTSSKMLLVVQIGVIPENLEAYMSLVEVHVSTMDEFWEELHYLYRREQFIGFPPEFDIVIRPQARRRPKCGTTVGWALLYAALEGIDALLTPIERPHNVGSHVVESCSRESGTISEQGEPDTALAHGDCDDRNSRSGLLPDEPKTSPRQEAGLGTVRNSELDRDHEIPTASELACQERGTSFGQANGQEQKQAAAVVSGKNKIRSMLINIFDYESDINLNSKTNDPPEKGDEASIRHSQHEVISPVTLHSPGVTTVNSAPPRSADETRLAQQLQSKSRACKLL